MKKQQFIHFLSLTSLIFLFGCTQGSNNSQKTIDPDSSEIVVSVSSLIKSGGLSISSPSSDLIDNIIDFGISGDPLFEVQKKITIKNDTLDSIPMNISITGTNFKAIINRCESILLAKKSCSIVVKFQSRNLHDGQYNEQISINSDPNLQFVLSGEITNNPIPTEGNGVVSISYESFHTTTVPNSGSVRREVIVTNQTNDKIISANNLIPSLTGNGLSYYGIWLNRCQTPLMPKKSCSIIIASNRKVLSLPNFPPLSLEIGSLASAQLACPDGHQYLSDSCSPIEQNITINQPSVGEILGPVQVPYGESALFEYIAPIGYKVLEWQQDCLGKISNICELINIESNKEISLIVGCDNNYHDEGGVCVLDSFPITLIQPHGGGLSIDINPVPYGGTATITYAPGSGYEFGSWITNCSSSTSTTCVIENIVSEQTVEVDSIGLAKSIILTIPGENLSSVQMDICHKVDILVKDEDGQNLNRSVATNIEIPSIAGIDLFYDSTCLDDRSSLNLTIPAHSSITEFYIKALAVSQGTYTINGIFNTGGSFSQGIVFVRSNSCESAKLANHKNLDGTTSSGVYGLQATGGGKHNVYCDMDSEDGPWMLVLNSSSSSTYTYTHNVWTTDISMSSTIPHPTSNLDQVSKAFYTEPINVAKLCITNSTGTFICEKILSQKDTPKNLSNGADSIRSGGTLNFINNNLKSISQGSWSSNSYNRWGWNHPQLSHGNLRIGFSSDMDSGSDNLDSFIGIGMGTGNAVDSNKCTIPSGSGYCHYNATGMPSPRSSSRRGQIWVKNVPVVEENCQEIKSNYSYMILSSSQYTIKNSGIDKKVACDFITEGGGWTRVDSPKYTSVANPALINDLNLTYNRVMIQKSPLDPNSRDDFATPINDNIWEWTGWALTRNSFMIGGIYYYVPDTEPNLSLSQSPVGIFDGRGLLISKSNPSNICYNGVSNISYNANVCPNSIVLDTQGERITGLFNIESGGSNNSMNQTFEIWVKNETEETYANSCKQLLDQNPGLYARDGVYKIKFVGETSPTAVYCDMTFAGGGWTAIESTSLAMARSATYQKAAFTQDLIRGGSNNLSVGSPFPWSDYRISKARMSNLCGTNCDWLSRVKYSSRSPNSSWLRVYGANLTNWSQAGGTLSIEATIRGTYLTRANRNIWNQTDAYHAHVDTPNLGIPNSVSSEDAFGFYVSVNSALINNNDEWGGSHITIWFIR